MFAVPSSINLTYFDIPGQAEDVKLAFMSRIAFQDRRISRDEFVRLKPDLPTGQLPILTMDGTTVPQSGAILRFAGKIGCLYPGDALAAARCDSVNDIMFDIQAAIRLSIYETNPNHKVLVGIPGDILEEFPRIRAYSMAVDNHPKIQASYDSGPGRETGDGSPALLPLGRKMPI